MRLCSKGTNHRESLLGSGKPFGRVGCLDAGANKMKKFSWEDFGGLEQLRKLRICSILIRGSKLYWSDVKKMAIMYC